MADTPAAVPRPESGRENLGSDPTRAIGCSIFRREIEHLFGEGLPVIWLPAGLHVSNDRLREALAGCLGRQGPLACLYGACHPELDLMLEKKGGRRLQAGNCIEAFLSPTDRARFGDRAFFMTPGWLREWRSIFLEGLGWDEIDARQSFGAYDTIVVLDFGLETIDDYAVLEFFDYVQTPIEIVPATLDYFEEKVRELLR